MASTTKMQEEYTLHPFYGSLIMLAWLGSPKHKLCSESVFSAWWNIGFGCHSDCPSTATKNILMTPIGYPVCLEGWILSGRIRFGVPIQAMCR